MKKIIFLARNIDVRADSMSRTTVKMCVCVAVVGGGLQACVLGTGQEQKPAQECISILPNRLLAEEGFN